MLPKKIENLLTPTYHKNLLDDAKWHLKYGFDSQTVYNAEQFKLYEDDNIFDVGQLTCTIYNPSQAHLAEFRFKDYFPHIKPLIYTIEDKFNLRIRNLHRVKFNILFQRPDAPEGSYNHPHRDVNAKSYSVIYYLNDSDGDTVFFNEVYDGVEQPKSLTIQSKNTPKANTAVLFDSRQLHASSQPKVTAARYAINIVFDADLLGD